MQLLKAVQCFKESFSFITLSITVLLSEGRANFDEFSLIISTLTH